MIQQQKTNTMKNFLTSEELKIGNTYHIKNNWANNLDDLWWLNMTLKSIENEHGGDVKILVFSNTNFNVDIDMEFVSKNSNPNYKFYQIIKAN